MLDSRRVNQVVDNLLSNALKFTAAGGEIKVASQAWGDGEIILWVMDSGIGIPPDALELIFEKYRQLDGGGSATRRDTGLGLAICKKIVEAHGGRIWVESEVGRGSAFYVSLPLQTDDRSSATPA